MSLETPSRLHFADSVSETLSHFAHTGNVALLDKAKLIYIYNTARDIIEEETDASHLNTAALTTAETSNQKISAQH